MELRRTQQIVLKFAFFVFWFAVIVSCIEILARQTPYSPMSLPLPIEPISQLRLESFFLGILCILWTLLEHIIYQKKEPTWQILILMLSIVTKILILSIASFKGMMAIQMNDPRPYTTVLFNGRMIADVGLIFVLLDMTLSLFRDPVKRLVI